jgi:tRNA (guanine-N7-)-methyltransferase
MESLTPEKFRLRSFRLRGERMTKAQSEALLSHWNKFEIPLQGEINPQEVFYGMKPDEFIMEIGSGMGEATAQIAAARPRTGYIAVEVHKPGIGALIIHAERAGIRNLRIIEGDIWEVLTQHWIDSSLDAFHIFFPDPWPKRKQSKRRLLQPAFILLLAKKLKPGGRVHIATDWVPYAEEIEKHFASCADFKGGVIPRPEWRPLTKFENKGLNKEHRVTDFLYTRN